MTRAASLLFAILCYAIFFATFLYLIIFIGDFELGPLSPKTVDNPPSELPVAASLVIDIALVVLFGTLRFVMARPDFSRAWAAMIPPQIDRSMSMLLTSAALLILFRFWQPVDTVLWTTGDLLRDLLLLLFWAGFLTILVSTFLINHFELLGLQQAGLNLRREPAAPPSFRAPLLYRWVRHPIYAGFFLVLWATPEMTAGHLLLAVGMSISMLVAIRHEERDLVTAHGSEYEDYRGRVGMLVPRFKKRTRR